MKQSTLKKLEAVVIFFAILMAFVWACKGTGVSFPKFIKGVPFSLNFIKTMYPPDVSILPSLVPRIIETIQIAVVAILITVVCTFPLAFLAARNMSPNYATYKIARLVIGILRSIPSLLYALVFICAVGLGPFPGVLGLVFHTTGALGKYFSECIENINPRIIDGIRSTGADRLQIILFGVIPELKPLLLGYTFYYFEYCLRTATILGIVGAGGIGMELLNNIRLFQNRAVFMIMILIVSMVIIVDTTSFLIRKRMIGLKR